MLRTFSYAGFFVASVVAGTYATFPWDAAKDRIFDLVEKKSGVEIRAKSITPSWLTGIEAKEVEIVTKRGQEPIKLDRLTARAKVLALLTGKLGVSARLPIGTGQLACDVTASDARLDVGVDIEGVQLDQVAPLQAAGASLGGKADMKADLRIAKKDPKGTEGTISLSVEGLVLKKGTKLGMFPLPRDFSLGDVKIDIPIKEGKADLKGIRLAGPTQR